MSRRNLNIMVDIDEVIFPLGDSIHALAHREGLHDNSQPWMQWEAWLQYGCSEEAYWHIWEIFSKEGYYTSIAPEDGDVQALYKLIDDGHRINLVTARGFFANGTDVRRWTEEWLRKFMIPHHTLTFTQDKPATQRHLGRFDLAIDDSPENYAALDADGVQVWLQDHPYNRHFEDARRIEDLSMFATLAAVEART